MSSVDDRVAQGAAALARGDWTGARGHFEASLDREESTAALEGLSDALFWLEEIGPSIERRTRACMLYQEGGNACRAARAALWLAMSYFSALGNSAAGNGWLQRAERLLEDAGPCAERGWLVQLRGKMIPDARTTEMASAAAGDTTQQRCLDCAERSALHQPVSVLSLGPGDWFSNFVVTGLLMVASAGTRE